MKLLELFSGTQSVGKVATQLGYDVISVDINDYNGVYTPTHTVDIMEFDYSQYSPNEFDVVWASPPCLYYSVLQYSWYGRNKKDGLFTKVKHDQQLAIADSWVKKVFEFFILSIFLFNSSMLKVDGAPVITLIAFFPVLLSIIIPATPV